MRLAAAVPATAYALTMICFLDLEDKVGCHIVKRDGCEFRIVVSVVDSGMPSYSSRSSGTKHLFETRENPPEHYLIAHSDGGARGNPGPAGYGVVVQDESGRKVAALSEYLGHQTNNFAEYQGLIAALEYALKHGPKALKLISDSELLVRQIKGIYKVKNATLQELHGRAKELIAQLDWFSIGHALREHNQEADQLANDAMDKGMGRSVTHVAAAASAARSSNQQEFEGIVRNGAVEVLNGTLPEGTRVQLRVKK
jgi:ribonuclease HI